MPVKFNINNVLKMYEASGESTTFPKSLRKVLRFLQNDKNIDNIKEASYFLATAKAESDYSLTRWESDYLCGEKGTPYQVAPCEKALRYYRSSDGKSNYYSKGVDSLGIPYFGRGLIQLTNKYNYEKYGKLIGVDLVNDGDKALVPKNSYNIASEYLKARTFKHVNSNNLTQARKSVNGGTKGVDRTNKEYNLWVSILSSPEASFKVGFWTRRKRVVFTSVIVISSLVGVYFAVKKLR